MFRSIAVGLAVVSLGAAVQAEPISQSDALQRRSDAVAHCASEATVTVFTTPAYCSPPPSTLASSTPPATTDARSPPPPPPSAAVPPPPPPAETAPPAPSTYGLPPPPPESISTTVCTECTTWVNTVTLPSEHGQPPVVTTATDYGFSMTSLWGWGGYTTAKSTPPTATNPSGSETSLASPPPAPSGPTSAANVPHPSITSAVHSPSMKPSFTMAVPSDVLMSMPNAGNQVVMSPALMGLLPLALALF